MDKGVSISGVWCDEWNDILDEIIGEASANGLAGLVVDAGGCEVVTKEQIRAVQDAMLAEDQPKPVLVFTSGAMDGVGESLRQLLSNRDDVVICDDDMPKIDAVNVGTIGHVDNQMTVEIKMRDEEPPASDYGFDFRKRNKSDRKRNRANRWR